MLREPRLLRAFPALLSMTLAASAAAASEGVTLHIGSPHPPLVSRALQGEKTLSVDHFRGRKILVLYFTPAMPDSYEVVATWREQTRDLVKSGKLALLGVMLEQHQDRGRLFAQWKNIDFPVIFDPLNLAEIEKFPTVIGLDEEGLVRVINPGPKRLGRRFINKKFESEQSERRSPILEPLPPKYTRRMAGEARTGKSWREHGDASVLGGLPLQIREAIDAYQRAVSLDPKDAFANFRLGVAYRIRFDRPDRQLGDFQSAINAWRGAARADPRNKLFRSRIQQYGVRTERPDEMYGWIARARKDIAARGETPTPLEPAPMAVELAKPRKKFRRDKSDPPPGGSEGTISSDEASLIELETAVVRGVGKSGRDYAQILLMFRPKPDGGVQWDNRQSSLRVWIEPPAGTRLSKRFMEYKAGSSEPTKEERTLNSEIRFLKKAKKSAMKIKGHALCAVMTDPPQLLRRDFEIEIPPE